MSTFTGLVPTFPAREQWTLPAVLRHRADTHGDRVYLDVPDEGLRLTYAEMLATAERVATHLLGLDGVAPGDRVLIMAANGSPYLFGWFGSALAGMVEVPINTAYRGAFLEHQVRTVEPTVAIIDAEFAERFAESWAACASIRHVFVTGDDGVAPAADALTPLGCRVEPFRRLLEPVAVGALPEVRREQLASVFFTSGTTGLSKGVMMPHAHMYFFADECVTLTRLGDGDAYCSVGPLFHGNAQFLAAYPALIAGARFVLGRRFSASGWLELMRTSGATVTNFVGVMMDFVWKQPPTADDAGNDLRCIFAAPTASSILAGFQERFGIEAFVEVFGLTETAMPILTPYGVERPAGAAGLLAEEWFEVRLVDPVTDEEVPVGEVGELTVRPKAPWTTFLGYYGMPERTVEAWRNQWIHTGDGMRRDADGWYYFVDRLKDSIRRRGENISSYEVEQAILPHAGVAEVAVVAVPATVEAGEDEVMAYVVPAGTPPSPSELWAWCDERLPYFAVPRYLAFVDELPKTPSEKVRKIELRERAGAVERLDREAVRT